MRHRPALENAAHTRQAIRKRVRGGAVRKRLLNGDADYTHTHHHRRLDVFDVGVANQDAAGGVAGSGADGSIEDGSDVACESQRRVT